jgi:hypothetical protein
MSPSTTSVPSPAPAAAAGDAGPAAGVEQVTDQVVDLGDRPGRAHPGRKLLTLVHAIVPGGDCIDDVELLRCGSTQAVLGHRVMAASTVGTFLRSFTFGHVRQLDRVCGELLARAWAAGAGLAHLPAGWPWAHSFTMALARLRCIPYPT